MTLHEKIEGIASKINRLVEEKQRLQSKNDKLQQEIKNLRSTISLNEEMVTSLKVQLGKTQVALDTKHASDPEESKQLRKKFDKYIEELDKCIEWLENT